MKDKMNSFNEHKILKQYNVFVKRVLTYKGFGLSLQDRVVTSLSQDSLWFFVPCVCTRMHTLARSLS